MRLLLAAALLTVGCSDVRLVSDATASYVAHEQQYEWDCVEVKGPPECAATQTALKEAKRQTELANRVYKIGKLPKSERAKLKAAAAALEAK